MTDIEFATRASLYPTDVRWAVLEEIRREALANMTPDLADFLESGAGIERTLQANRDAFDRWLVRPRPMNGVWGPDTSTAFLGVPLALPVLTAPFGGDGLFSRDGHLAVARANARCGTASIVPEAGTFSYEDVAATAPAAARFAQLHPWQDFSEIACRARLALYSALCVTIDCPTAGFRSRNRSNRFDPDLSFFAGNASRQNSPGVGEVMGRLVGSEGGAWGWMQLAQAARDTGMPWIAKGVLDGDTAERAIEHGASAVVVSNHGGRQLDPVPASLDVLPEVVHVVNGRVPVAFDSGIRTGADVFIALALGASVVIIGRLAVYGLAAGGEAGVRRTLELLGEELRTMMTLAGVPDVKSFTSTLLRPGPS